MFYEEKIEALASKINEIADARVEYETTHEDALDAYSHLPREGEWTYRETDKLLAKRARDLGLSVPEEMEDALGDACLERITWRFDSQYHGGEAEDLGAFPICEIETQIDFADLPEWFSKALLDGYEVLEDLNRACEHYVQKRSDAVYVYSTVDAAVFYSLSDKALREAHAAVMGEA